MTYITGWLSAFGVLIHSSLYYLVLFTSLLYTLSGVVFSHDTGNVMDVTHRLMFYPNVHVAVFPVQYTNYRFITVDFDVFVSTVLFAIFYCFYFIHFIEFVFRTSVLRDLFYALLSFVWRCIKICACYIALLVLSVYINTVIFAGFYYLGWRLLTYPILLYVCYYLIRQIYAECGYLLVRYGKRVMRLVGDVIKIFLGCGKTIVGIYLFRTIPIVDALTFKETSVSYFKHTFGMTIAMYFVLACVVSYVLYHFLQYIRVNILQYYFTALFRNYMSFSRVSTRVTHINYYEWGALSLIHI